MSSADRTIGHVSDTALLVAACRALESEDADGLVHDPFAARLAGDRGRAMLEASPRSHILRFGIGIRSHFIDGLLLDALRAGSIATVLSLGCGLDTRPWRLDLPPGLRWVEADFGDMLDYKDGAMAAEQPRCRRERIAADINEPSERRRVYQAVGRDPALMITEGLLMYLPSATVEALAAESWQESGIGDWMADIATTAFARAIQMDTMQRVRHVQAPDALSGEQMLECLGRHGWKTAAHKSYLTDVAFAMPRIRRLMGAPADAPGPPPTDLNDPTGVHRFARA